MEFYQLSFIAAIVFVILEMLTGTFIFLGFGIGSLFVGICQYMFNGLSINRDLLFFTFASLISIFLLRKIFKSKSDQKLLDEEDINQY
jgi:membrane protein implicated in regulation of membrane protease activity